MPMVFFSSSQLVCSLSRVNVPDEVDLTGGSEFEDYSYIEFGVAIDDIVAPTEQPEDVLHHKSMVNSDRWMPMR